MGNSPNSSKSSSSSSNRQSFNSTSSYSSSLPIGRGASSFSISSGITRSLHLTSSTHGGGGNGGCTTVLDVVSSDSWGDSLLVGLE
ncbi:hypothetical protein BT69DRAFT_527424 [Atractiella rhizophila]|nr:hypothetical protein BT69DRAFT_527424 [Atractiella rhizophila]